MSKELEKYYNMFLVMVRDFASMVRLKVPNDIYCAAEDVKKTILRKKG